MNQKTPRPVPPKRGDRAGNWKSLAHASGSQITQSPRHQQGITRRSSDLLLPASAAFSLTPTYIVDRLFTGHAAQVLACFPDACIDLIVTSPPYWTAVEYGHGRGPWPAWRARQSRSGRMARTAESQARDGRRRSVLMFAMRPQLDVAQFRGGAAPGCDHLKKQADECLPGCR